MATSKVESEQLFELTEPYSKADLRNAVRTAMMKWHPDRATANGIDLQEATRKYGQIEESKKYLEGFFDGKPDDFKIAPTTPTQSQNAGSSSSNTSNYSPNTQDASQRPNGSQTSRGTTRNSTNRGTTRNATSQADRGSQQGNGSSQGNRPRNARPQGQRPNAATGDDTQNQNRRGSVPNDGANDRPRPTPEEQAERRRRAEARRRARQRAQAGYDQSADPSPRPSSGYGSTSGYGPEPQSDPMANLSESDRKSLTVIQAAVEDIGLIRKVLLVLLAIHLLLSLEVSVKMFDPNNLTPLLIAQVFGTPLVSLVLFIVELRSALITKLLKVFLLKMATGLATGKPWAKTVVILVKATYGIAKLLYRLVSWVLGYLLK